MENKERESKRDNEWRRGLDERCGGGGSDGGRCSDMPSATTATATATTVAWPSFTHSSHLYRLCPYTYPRGSTTPGGHRLVTSSNSNNNNINNILNTTLTIAAAR